MLLQRSPLPPASVSSRPFLRLERLYQDLLFGRHSFVKGAKFYLIVIRAFIERETVLSLPHSITSVF